MDSEIPDHVPAGMSMAEGYRYLRDSLRTALELPEDDLREVVSNIADALDGLARGLDS